VKIDIKFTASVILPTVILHIIFSKSSAHPKEPMGFIEKTMDRPIVNFRSGVLMGINPIGQS
jgi:hypothetical protein